MPRKPEQYDAIRSTTKEKIKAAGLKLFAYKGLAATSIQDIATQADISNGLMYHYYKSKEDLFTELVETAVASAAEATQKVFTSALPPAEKIRLFSQEVVGEISRSDWMSQLYLLMIHYTLAVDLPEKSSLIQMQGGVPLQSLKRTILEGQALGEIQLGDAGELALLYFASIQGLAIYKLTIGDQFVAPDPHLLDRLLLKSAEEG